MDKAKMRKWTALFVKIYIFALVLYQTLWQIVPVRVFLLNTGLDIISPALAVVGLAFLLVDIFIEKTIFQSKYCVFLIAAVVIMGISSLLYINYGWADNAKVIVWQVVQMFLIYSFYLRLNKEELQKYSRNIFIVISAIFTVAVIISIYQFIMQISYNTPVEGSNNRQGFQENRLFGIFGYVFFAPLMSLLLGMGAVYSSVKAKRVWLKVLFAVQAVLFFIYVVLSGTRSTLVSMIFGIAVCGALIARNILTEKRKNWSNLGRRSSVIAVAVVCAVLVYGAYSGTHTLLSKIPVVLGTQHSVDSGNTGDTDNEDDISEPIEGDIDILERPDTQSGDISNGRFKIWKDYLSCGFSSVKTVLFGFSPNYMSIIQEEFPDIYIVQYSKEHFPQSFEMGRIYDTHNGYLAMDISTGILGFAAMMAFLICILIRAIKYFIKRKHPDGISILIFTMLVVIAVAILFDTDIFYKCSCGSIIFWLLIGCMVKYTELPENKGTGSDSLAVEAEVVNQSEVSE